MRSTPTQPYMGEGQRGDVAENAAPETVEEREGEGLERRRPGRYVGEERHEPLGDDDGGVVADAVEVIHDLRTELSA